MVNPFRHERQRIQRRNDRTFQIILDREFWSDLERLRKIQATPYYDRDREDNLYLEHFRKKYRLNERVSHLYAIASPALQAEYDIVHSLICTYLQEEERTNPERLNNSTN